MERNRKRTKKRPRVRYVIDYGRLFRTLFLFSLLCFALYKGIYGTFFDPMKSYKAIRTITPISETHRAVVIRKEYLIKARTYGKVDFFIKDREWVDNGQKLIKYICLKAYDNKIDKALISEKPVSEAAVNKSVEAKAAKISKLVSGGIYQGVNEEKTAIIQLLSKLPNSKYSSVEKAGSDSLQLKYLGDVGCIKGEESIYYSPAKGLVSYEIDGYEESLHSSKLRNLDIEALEGKIEPESFTDKLQVKTEAEEGTGSKKYFERNSIVCKIIDDSQCLLAIEEDISKLGIYKKDSTVNIKVGEEITSAQVVDIYPSQKKDMAIVVFKPADYIKPFYDERFLDVEITLEKCIGIGVKPGSLVNKDGVEGVYIADPENKPEFIRIEAMGKNGDITVVRESYFMNKVNGRNINVKTLDEGDRILVNGSRWN